MAKAVVVHESSTATARTQAGGFDDGGGVGGEGFGDASSNNGEDSNGIGDGSEATGA